MNLAHVHRVDCARVMGSDWHVHGPVGKSLDIRCNQVSRDVLPQCGLGAIFQGHYYDIKTKNDTTVARHFNRCPVDKPGLFDGIRITILSFMRNPLDSNMSQGERDLEEKRWMHRLASIVPKGLNLMD